MSSRYEPLWLRVQVVGSALLCNYDFATKAENINQLFLHLKHKGLIEGPRSSWKCTINKWNMRWNDGLEDKDFVIFSPRIRIKRKKKKRRS